MATASETSKPKPSEQALREDPRWQAVERIVASATFARATRLASFLLYICERALLGLCDEINEQQVGIHVFGRPADYDPSGDNIVRGTARQLRQRLAVYYQEEGQAELMRISVPRGGYVPIFEMVEQAAPVLPVVEAAPAAEDSTVVEAAPVVRRRRFTLFAWLGVSALAMVVGVVFLATRQRPVDRFWHAVFPSDRKTLLVPGDSGFVMYQNLTGRTVPLSDYAGGAYSGGEIVGSGSAARLDPDVLKSLSTRRYTSFADLKFDIRLVLRAQVARDRLELRYARDLRVEDLKQANAVLVGAPQGNPWVGLFCRDLDFCIVSDELARKLIVTNRNPRPGEPVSYTYSYYDPAQRAYATIALVDNLDHSGKVLIVGGTTVAGIDAAADFLFNDSLMDPLVRQWLDAGGQGRFELLVETSGVAANGSAIRLIASHISRGF